MRTARSNKNIIPGIYRIWLIPLSDIRTYVINPQSKTVKITLYEGKVPTLLDTAIDSISATISTVYNDAGVYYRCNIRGFIPGISDVNQNMMMEFSEEKFVVLMSGYDAVRRSIGTPDIPIDFTFVERYSPRLGYEVIMTADIPNTLLKTVMQYEIGAPPVIPPENPDPTGYTVTVSVIDENQINYIENAVVMLSNGSTSYEGTNAQGIARFFNVPDGSYTLQVSKTGYQETGSGILINGQNLNITFVLYAET